MKPSISKAGRRVLRAVAEYQEMHGYAATRNDLAQILGYRSDDGVTAQLIRLKKAGFLRMRPGSPRSLQIVDDEHTPVPIIPLGPVPKGVPAVDPSRATGAIEPAVARAFVRTPDLVAVAVDDAMAGLGIRAGDRIAIELTDRTKNGSIVLAHIDNQLLLRRLVQSHPGRSHPRLLAADPTGTFPPIKFDRGARPAIGRMIGAIVGTPPIEK